MKKILILLLLSSLLGNLAFAQTTPTTPIDGANSVPVTKGEPAPFDGVELNNQAAEDNNIKLQQGDLANQEINDLNNAMGFKDKQITDLTNAYNLSEQKSDLFSKEALAANAQLETEHKDQTLNNLLYFGGGVIATILLTFAVSSAIKAN
jgi:hypothetical protein